MQNRKKACNTGNTAVYIKAGFYTLRELVHSNFRRDYMIIDFILSFPKLGYTFYRNGKYFKISLIY